MKIAVISGGFDPLHSGHLSYVEAAASYGDKLIVCLNSDDWLIKKKGKYFLPFSERQLIVKGLKFVDEVISFEDDDIGSCINGLISIKKKYPNDQILFCNGGDRKKENIPEMSVGGIDFQFSVGGDEKMNSSSWILKSWSFESETRVWGKFFNLHQDNNIKVKELIVEPGKGMSFQKHFFRQEIWLISKGKCLINYSKDDPKNKQEIILEKHDYFIVNIEDWHQITNPYNVPCHIIEIQYGTKTQEDDIERLYYFDENKKNNN
ncbi:adenylyltransferase/cytidyltransferase family protein [Gammaproteobacteria bacterium]|jgi:cytidyltransferase-like protein|nr:adenylyltransferase/cytidyltransferase family protein [Gammaproteobacteria bacterium]